MASYSTMNTVPAADVESETPLHSGSDAKDRVVYGESCDHEKQHWKIIQL